MQWLKSRSCCNSRIISSISQPTTGLDSNLGKTKMKRERAWGGAQFSDVWTCKGCDIENGNVLWKMNSYHHELPKDLIAAEAIAQAICQRSQSSWSCLTQTAGGDVAPVLPCTLQRKYAQNHRATCPGRIAKSEFVLALKGKRVKFQELWGQATSINKTSVMQHTWYDNTTLNKTYRGNCWWQDLGTKNLIPNTCKSGEAALSGNFIFFFLIFIVSLDWKIIRNESNPCITMKHLEIESRQSEKRPHGVAFVRLQVHPSFLHPSCRHAPALWQFSTSSMSLMARAHFHDCPPKCLRGRSKAFAFFGTMPPTFSLAMSSAALSALMS